MIGLRNGVHVRVGSLKWFWWRIIKSEPLEDYCRDCHHWLINCICMAEIDGAWNDAKSNQGGKLP